MQALVLVYVFECLWDTICNPLLNKEKHRFFFTYIAFWIFCTS